MKKNFYLICLLIWGITGFTQTRTLSIIGSSTAACYGFSGNMNDCWPNRLSNYYTGIGQPFQMYNLAVDGANVYHGMPTGSPEIYINGNPVNPDPNRNITKALSFSPNVVIVNYPSNGYDVMDIHNVLLYFRTIKAAANNAGRVCFIATTQPRNFDPAGRAKLMELKDSILLQFGFYAINFWDNLANPDGTINPFYGQGDGTHLNSIGHDTLFKRVLAKNIFSAALPVKISRFTAQSKNKQVLLQWKAAHDIMNTAFTIERSKNGVDFHPIKTMEAKGPSGENQYDYLDENPPSGLVYYRLQVTEADKKYYSAIVTARNTTTSINIERLYPVPATKDLHLSVVSNRNQRITIEILNSLGARIKTISHFLQNAESLITLPVHQLSTGTYYLKLTSESGDQLIRSFNK